MSTTTYPWYKTSVSVDLDPVIGSLSPSEYGIFSRLRNVAARSPSRWIIPYSEEILAGMCHTSAGAVRRLLLKLAKYDGLFFLNEECWMFAPLVFPDETDYPTPPEKAETNAILAERTAQMLALEEEARIHRIKNAESQAYRRAVIDARDEGREEPQREAYRQRWYHARNLQAPETPGVNRPPVAPAETAETAEPKASSAVEIFVQNTNAAHEKNGKEEMTFAHKAPKSEMTSAVSSPILADFFGVSSNQDKEEESEKDLRIKNNNNNIQTVSESSEKETSEQEKEEEDKTVVVVELLCNQGIPGPNQQVAKFKQETVSEMLQKHSPEEILQQIEWLPHRNHNPRPKAWSGFVLDAIMKGYAEPSSWQKHLAHEREKEKRKQEIAMPLRPPDRSEPCAFPPPADILAAARQRTKKA